MRHTRRRGDRACASFHLPCVCSLHVCRVSALAVGRPRRIRNEYDTSSPPAASSASAPRRRRGRKQHVSQSTLLSFNNASGRLECWRNIYERLLQILFATDAPMRRRSRPSPRRLRPPPPPPPSHLHFGPLLSRENAAREDSIIRINYITPRTAE